LDPVLRWMPARVTVALGLVGGTLVALVGAYLSLVWLFDPVAFAAMVLAAVAAPGVAGAIWRGRWSGGSSGAVQRICFAVVAAALASFALLAGLRVREEHRVRGLGVPTEAEIGVWLVLVAGALVCLAVLVVAAPGWLSSAATRIVATVAALAGGAALVTAAATEAGVSCADARVDRATWQAALRDDRVATVTYGERLAAAIVECGLLDGRAREEVRQALGRPYPAGRNRWTWEVGWVNDGLGPGDGQTLTVYFDRDGRVSRSTLAHPRED
jgi:hypothetical protein